jgi:hypothetical protein
MTSPQIQHLPRLVWGDKITEYLKPIVCGCVRLLETLLFFPGLLLFLLQPLPEALDLFLRVGGHASPHTRIQPQISPEIVAQSDNEIVLNTGQPSSVVSQQH